MADEFAIEVAYANNTTQCIIPLNVTHPCTVREAIERSGVLARYQEINLATCKVGIFSEQVTLETLVKPDDRIEIYRPLVADPKEARRKRV